MDENDPTLTQESTPNATLNNLPEERKTFFKKKKVMIIAGILLALIVGIIAFLQLRQSPDTVANLPPPEPENVLLATVGEKQIYWRDVNNLALENYLASAIDNNVLKLYLNIAIERAILDKEAERLKISITSAEIELRKKSAAAKKTDLLIKYDLLKEKVMKAQIKNVVAYTVGFWIASFDYPQLPEYTVQREKGKIALAEIQLKFIANEKAVDIAKYTAESYPELSEIVAINGLIYVKTTDLNLLENPRTYTLNPTDKGKPYNDDEVFDALSKIKAGEVVKVERKNGSGGTVIKAVSINNSGFASYEDFLTARKKEIVKIISNL